ncbi:copper-binding protein [Aquabacterium lacunae]|uniref:copper-binding protein n=1 Tax=Aquabacterium lacunae TaxID=2528630 RepID=UPI001FE0D862|nr:copper-binding protein [Aquabacterium lacunae]
MNRFGHWIRALALVGTVTASGLSHAQAVDGEVRKVDADAGKITLKHGEIKNLDMPAMQMAFRVADPGFLKKVNVGDKVTFTADKLNGQFTVTSIDVKK